MLCRVSQVVVSGAALQCTFGVAPSTLNPVPKGAPVSAAGRPAATITDMQPMANVPSFGMCMTPTNPQVAAATAAALGVLTPQPCIPMITSPWTPGSPTVLINGTPALTNTSTCMCAWGGVISIVSPGQVTVQAP
jgi:uncharacterized Zn-binding protein involved in type VI secretion